jgi:hypothetical protein
MKRSIVLACAVAGALLCAAPAQAASTGFDIYNLTSKPMKLYSIDHFGPGGFETGGIPPKVGDVLMPGAPPLHVELDYLITRDNTRVDLTYRRSDYERFGFDDPRRYSGFKLFLNSYRRNDGCSPSSREFQCKFDHDKVVLLDPPGTVHEVKGDKAQDQAEVLRMLCTKTNKASCAFTPTDWKPLVAPARLAGDPVGNCDEHAVESEYEFGRKEGESTSVGIEVAAGFETDFIFEKVTVEVTLKAEHEWTKEFTFKQKLSLHVAPGDISWVSATAPIIRDWGDFKLTLGNTEWNLRDVYVDTPDPKRKAQFTPDHRAMTPAEYKARCAHVIPDNGLSKAPASWVSTHEVGSGGHDRMVGRRESNTLRGLRGNDAILGGAGHDGLFGGTGEDRLSGGAGNDVLHGEAGHDVLGGGAGRDALEGGAGNDVLHGGPGRDVLDGGSRADTMVDADGPTLVRTGTSTGRGRDDVDVRDGRGDDTVMCGTRRTLVVADPGDRVSDRCGRVIRRGPAPPIPR